MALGKEWFEYIRLKEERPRDFIADDRLEIIYDAALVEAFQQESGRIIGVLYHSPYRILVVDLVKREGKMFAYERFLLTKEGAISTIPIYKNKFVLLRQFRHSIRGEQISFVRGFGEDGLNVIENAKKELAEELGAKTDTAIQLGSIIADCGASASPVAIVLCYIDNVELKCQYEGIQEILLLSKEELEEKIFNGEITDGYTVASFTLYKSWMKRQWRRL